MLASVFAVYDSLNETGCCVWGFLLVGCFPCSMLQQIEHIIEDFWLYF